MPTLQEATLDHSRRLSAIHRQRNDDLDAAARRRDAVLRGAPASAKAYDAYDRAIELAEAQVRTTASRARAVYRGEVAETAEARTRALGAAATSRKVEQLEALGSQVEADAGAERRYRDRVSPLGRGGNIADRQRRLAEAEQARTADLEQARLAYDRATVKVQADYRQRVTEALTSERQAVRDAERAHANAVRLAAAARTSAVDRAELALYQALAAIAETRDALRSYREEIAAVGERSRAAEEEEFARFRQQLREMGGSRSGGSSA